jgi:hypothetical protein
MTIFSIIQFGKYGPKWVAVMFTVCFNLFQNLGRLNKTFRRLFKRITLITWRTSAAKTVPKSLIRLALVIFLSETYALQKRVYIEYVFCRSWEESNFIKKLKEYLFWPQFWPQFWHSFYFTIALHYSETWL